MLVCRVLTKPYTALGVQPTTCVWCGCPTSHCACPKGSPKPLPGRASPRPHRRVSSSHRHRACQAWASLCYQCLPSTRDRAAPWPVLTPPCRQAAPSQPSMAVGFHLAEHSRQIVAPATQQSASEAPLQTLNACCLLHAFLLVISLIWLLINFIHMRNAIHLSSSCANLSVLMCSFVSPQMVWGHPAH